MYFFFLFIAVYIGIYIYDSCSVVGSEKSLGHFSFAALYSSFSRRSEETIAGVVAVKRKIRDSV